MSIRSLKLQFRVFVAEVEGRGIDFGLDACSRPVARAGMSQILPCLLIFSASAVSYRCPSFLNTIVGCSLVNILPYILFPYILI
jgi:hypothetical protein